MPTLKKKKKKKLPSVRSNFRTAKTYVRGLAGGAFSIRLLNPIQNLNQLKTNLYSTTAHPEFRYLTGQHFEVPVVSGFRSGIRCTSTSWTKGHCDLQSSRVRL